MEGTEEAGDSKHAILSLKFVCEEEKDEDGQMHG